MRPFVKPQEGRCRVCGGFYRIRGDDTVRQHGRGRGDSYVGCLGGLQCPLDPDEDYQPPHHRDIW